jgi:signal recognition particle subunit SRP54
MTVKERRNPKILNASRKRRIAAGSGTTVQDVNRLLKQYREARRMFKTLKKTGMRGLSRLFG